MSSTYRVPRRVPPRVRIPAAARERVHRAARAWAASAADTMIASLEQALSAELAAALRAPPVMPAGSTAGGEQPEGTGEGLAFGRPTG